jgi:hypothetical protein
MADTILTTMEYKMQRGPLPWEDKIIYSVRMMIPQKAQLSFIVLWDAPNH